MKRVKEFIIKMLSFKGIIFVLSTISFYTGKLPWYAWVISWSLVIGVRFVEKLSKVGFWSEK